LLLRVAFDLSYVPKVNILVLNEVEAGFLAEMKVDNQSDAEVGSSKLLDQRCGKCDHYLRKTGSICHDNGGESQVPAFKVDAVDTTAAGDTFCGAYAVAMVEGQSEKACLQFASAAAAISVTRMGAQPSFHLISSCVLH
jgi:ribokinase